VPVITLGKDTTRAAVCLVFEKVNTGGKALDSFELVTAMYAGQKFRLRDDWKVRRDRLLKQPILANVEPVEFLQVISLLHTKAVRTKAESEGRDPPAISANRNSLLQIPLSAYLEYADRVEQGYVTAAKFLYGLKIFRARDLLYQTQFVPLAAVLAELGPNWENDAVRKLLAQSSPASRSTSGTSPDGSLAGLFLRRSHAPISARSACGPCAPDCQPPTRASTPC
jgi:hypothetical protein